MDRLEKGQILQPVYRFVKDLIRFRKDHPILHMPQELRPTDYKSLGLAGNLLSFGTRLVCRHGEQQPADRDSVLWWLCKRDDRERRCVYLCDLQHALE